MGAEGRKREFIPTFHRIQILAQPSSESWKSHGDDAEASTAPRFWLREKIPGGRKLLQPQPSLGFPRGAKSQTPGASQTGGEVDGMGFFGNRIQNPSGMREVREGWSSGGSPHPAPTPPSRCPYRSSILPTKPLPQLREIPKIPKIGLLGASSPHPEGKILLGAPAGLWRCPVTQPRFICVTTER